MEPKTLEQGTPEEIEKEIEDLFGGAESPDEGDDLDDEEEDYS